MQLPTSPRILVLGSTGYDGVESYGWASIPRNISVAAFDVVILDFASSSAMTVVGDVTELPTREQFARLLLTDKSEVLVIGSPASQLCDFGDGLVDATWWLPISLDTHVETGTGVFQVAAEFEFFFRDVARWSFFVTRHFSIRGDLLEYGRLVHPNTLRNLSIQFSPIAQSRFKQSIGFRIRIDAELGGTADYIGPTSLASQVVWLPSADLVSSSEAIELILEKRYGRGAIAQPPEWATLFLLPNVQRLQEEIRNLRSALITAEDELVRESGFGQLLYASGDSLEGVVREALDYLGASVVTRPRDREDCRCTDPSGRSAIIEIKGRSGPAKLQDVRQLHQWVADAIADEEWTGKGILIVNAFSSEPPSQRVGVFPENTSRAAARFDLALLSTTQLFCAIRTKQLDHFDADNFWNRVFETKGICDLPDL